MFYFSPLQRLTVQSLTDAIVPEISIKSVHGKPIGPCSVADVNRSSVPKPTQQMSKNYPPMPRNQVDRVNATVGHLLVFKVPLVSLIIFSQRLIPILSYNHLLHKLGHIL